MLRLTRYCGTIHKGYKESKTNKQINKSLAQGVMFWFNNTQLDWAKYVVHYDNYNTNLKETKAVICLAQQTSGVV